MGLIYNDAEEDANNNNNNDEESDTAAAAISSLARAASGLGINDGRRLRRYLRSIAQNKQHTGMARQDNERMRKQLWKMHAGLVRCLASATAAATASPLNEVVRFGSSLKPVIFVLLDG